jgi:hypothetical protein
MKNEATGDTTTTGPAVVLQVTDSCRKWETAYEVLAGQRQQVGYLGGRLYQRDGLWHMQAFHDATGLQLGGWLPDGMRVCVLPLFAGESGTAAGLNGRRPPREGPPRRGPFFLPPLLTIDSRGSILCV